MPRTGITGETRLAYKLLVNDRTKFAALLLGKTGGNLGGHERAERH